MRILSVFGTRPEAIKMAPVIKVLQSTTGIESLVAVTAQHREMLDQVLDLFDITADFDLDLMKPGQTLEGITSKALTGVSSILEREKPDLVLVHGDTTTTLSASLAAYYKQIPVGHVEAGLRTGNIYSPWPEEINRKVTGAIARLHFAPTKKAAENLISEGVPAETITITGNTVIDALIEVENLLKKDEQQSAAFDQMFGIDKNRRMILITGHRRESFGDGFRRICSAISSIASTRDVQVIYPVHLNPNVKDTVEAELGDHENVHLIPPQDYLPFVHLMRRAHIILTDSGGVQEEAPSLGKPVLVMRDTTERPEAVDAGTVKLVGTDTAIIVKEATLLLDNSVYYETISHSHNPYGDGMASQKICDIILSFMGSKGEH